MKNSYKMLILCTSLCFSIPQAHAEGVNSNGTTLPIGAGGNTVLTINSDLTSSFAGPVSINGVINAPLGVNVNNNGILYPSGNAYIGGSLGVGTTSPIRSFHIYSSSGISAEQVIELANAPADEHKWNFVVDQPNHNNSLGTQFYIRQLNDAGTNGNVPLIIHSNSDIILNGTGNPETGAQPVGNVGIGTSSPSGTLDVENSTNNATIIQNGRQTYQTAGIYTVNIDGSCRYGNPLAGNGCACPAGYAPHQIYDFINGDCSNSYYSDGWRSSNCGIEQFQCL